MCFVLGLGVVGCGQDPVPEGESFIDPAEDEPEVAVNNVVDQMEPTVEEMPDPPDEPDVPPIAVPAVRCTTNVTADNPFPQQLPGWDRFEFDVQIAPETRSFLLVGYNERGNGAMIETMTKPGGDRVDYWLLDDARMITTWYYTTEGSVSALRVPDAPLDLGRLEPGTYTFEGISQDAEFCYYVVEDTAPGSRLQLNMFFVGSELTANNVQRNEDWEVVEEVIANTFASAGIEVEFDYREVPEALREDYAIPRSVNDLNAAVEAVIAASDPLPMRSVDVFIWDEFDGEAGQMHGMARGIPEAVGLHGEVGNGVVYQLAGQLGFEGIQPGVGETVGNFSIGLSLAHEIAHLLGLFHTSEFYTTAYDSLADTPQCEAASQTQNNCPDASNLMFPIGPLYESSALTDQQVAVMTAHPSLIRD